MMGGRYQKSGRCTRCLQAALLVYAGMNEKGEEWLCGNCDPEAATRRTEAIADIVKAAGPGTLADMVAKLGDDGATKDAQADRAGPSVLDLRLHELRCNAEDARNEARVLRAALLLAVTELRQLDGMTGTAHMRSTRIKKAGWAIAEALGIGNVQAGWSPLVAVAAKLQEKR